MDQVAIFRAVRPWRNPLEIRAHNPVRIGERNFKQRRGGPDGILLRFFEGSLVAIRQLEVHFVPEFTGVEPGWIGDGECAVNLRGQPPSQFQWLRGVCETGPARARADGRMSGGSVPARTGSPL